MKLNKVVLIVAGVLVIGGAGTYVLTKKDTPADEKQDSTTAQTTEQTNSDSGTPTFDPKATKNMSFVATIEGTSSDNTVLSGSIESDGKGAVHFTGTQAGETAEYYLDASGAFIFCQNNKCFRYAANQSGLNVGDYEVTDEDIAKFKETAKYAGTESCKTGTCNVWQYDDEGANTKIYINKNTKLVSEVVGEKDGDTFKVVYDFKDVTVTIPSDIEEITGSFEQGQ